MEPVFMMLGHAAGTAASLAIDNKATVQAVPYASLQKQLLADGQILDVNKIVRTPDTSKPDPEKTTPAAPNVQLVADLKVLVENKVVDAPDYWLANAHQGGQCDGRQVETMLIKMARSFKAVDTRAEAVRVLAEHKVIASPAYWNEHAAADRKCGGDNVRAIIRNFVRAAK
jgi:hypothetical protein